MRVEMIMIEMSKLQRIQLRKRLLCLLEELAYLGNLTSRNIHLTVNTYLESLARAEGAFSGPLVKSFWFLVSVCIG
jgi:hypothetical protein